MNELLFRLLYRPLGWLSTAFLILHRWCLNRGVDLLRRRPPRVWDPSDDRCPF